MVATAIFLNFGLALGASLGVEGFVEPHADVGLTRGRLVHAEGVARHVAVELRGI